MHNNKQTNNQMKSSGQRSVDTFGHLFLFYFSGSTFHCVSSLFFRCCWVFVISTYLRLLSAVNFWWTNVYHVPNGQLRRCHRWFSLNISERFSNAETRYEGSRSSILRLRIFFALKSFVFLISNDERLEKKDVFHIYNIHTLLHSQHSTPCRLRTDGWFICVYLRSVATAPVNKISMEKCCERIRKRCMVLCTECGWNV